MRIPRRRQPTPDTSDEIPNPCHRLHPPTLTMRTLHLLDNLEIRNTVQLRRLAYSPYVYVAPKSVNLARTPHDFCSHDARLARRARRAVHHNNVQNRFSQHCILISRRRRRIDLRQAPMDIDLRDSRRRTRVVHLHRVQVPIHVKPYMIRSAPLQLVHQILVRDDVDVDMEEESGV